MVSKRCRLSYPEHLHESQGCCNECFALGSDKAVFRQMLKCNRKMDAALLLRDLLFGKPKHADATKAKIVNSLLQPV